MKDQKKTKAQLIAELKKMRRRVSELEQSETGLGTTDEVLRESEEKYRILFETMTLGVVYQTADGQIISANPAAERILGLTLDQMQGRTSVDPRWQAIHEDGSDFPGETHPSLVSLKTRQPVHDVVMGIFHPGEEKHRWISIDAVPQFRPEEEKPYQVYTTFKNITERKRAEEALRESVRKLSFHLQNTPVAYIEWDHNFNVSEWNTAAVKTFGYSKREAMGKHAAELIVPESARELVDNVWKALLIQKGGAHNINENFTKKGETIICEWNNTPLTDNDGNVMGVASLVQDITERKMAEKQLERYKIVLENSSDLAYTCDLDGNITFLNRIFEELSGHKVEEFIGKSFAPLFEKENLEKAIDLYSRTTKGESPIRELAFKDTGKLCEYHNFPLKDEQELIIGVIGVARDITERKRAEDEIKKFRTISDRAVHG